MASLILYLPPRVENVAYFVAGIIITGLVVVKTIPRSGLDAILIVGPSSLLRSWWAGFNFYDNDFDTLREGCTKYKHRPFRIAERHRWLVTISSREHMEELKNATADVLSFPEYVRERMSGDYTMGKELFENLYHIPIIRSQLSRNDGNLFSEIRDEIITVFDDVLDLKHDGKWKSVIALNTIEKVVFRTNNRIFVGLPLCRDPDWMDFSTRHILDVLINGYILKYFPPFLEPFVSLFTMNVNRATERGMKFLAPIIAERQRCLDEHRNEWDDKPNDLLSSLMDAAEGEERTVKRLTNRVMLLNIISVHSTSQNFSYALFYLAANPQYMQPLREEVEVAMEQEGWSKAALAKMHKVDSFLKEIQRLKGITSESLARKAMKDFMFSDGTFIPKGTLVSAPAKYLHLDERIYENPTVFDPFRFSKMREADREGTKHLFVSTSLEYLPFGHGKYACPGRFFAASVMKTMLAHIVLSYDVMLEDNTTIPKCISGLYSTRFDPDVKVMFRERNQK